MNKTENYIILKPISERFNRIAGEISDDDIDYIIKDEIRKQIATINFKYSIEDIISEYLDNNSDQIIDILKKSISQRLK